MGFLVLTFLTCDMVQVLLSQQNPSCHTTKDIDEILIVSKDTWMKKNSGQIPELSILTRRACDWLERWSRHCSLLITLSEDAEQNIDFTGIRQESKTLA